MSKAKVSDAFSQFEARKSHTLKEARESEKQSRGNPLPVGYNGVGVITDAKADISKRQEHYAVVEVTIVNDPVYEGKTVGGAVRTFKDTAKQTAEEAYANFLDDLEDMGLPRKVREESTSLAEYFDELLSTPHYVSVTVTANTYTSDGKGVKCYAIPAPGETASAPAAESTKTPEKDDVDYSVYDQCLYLGKPHYIVHRNDDGTSNLVSCKNKSKRDNIPSEDITLIENEE